jgi:sulfite reductase (NADPH) flavoprotein alpha-component
VSANRLGHAWSAFLSETRETGFTTATVNLPREPGRPIEIRYIDADPAHERANNTLTLDSGTAAVVTHERYDNKRTGEKFMSSIFPLHSGSFFGLPGVVLYMIASLAMPVFAITGWMLYLDRRRKKKAARAAESAASGKSNGKSAADAAEPLLLGFASQAGFAREVAWQTAGSLQAAGIAVEVHPLERLDREKLGRASKALFVVSTFGEGEPPDDARSFARRFMRESASFPNLKFGVLALGDRQYKTFCEFGRTLDRWLHKQGASPLFPTVEVDKGDPAALERWREQLGSIANGASIARWEERPFHVMRLVERRVLNPGSAGGPTFHLELEGTHPGDWEAGDIAEIEIEGAADGIQQLSPAVTREFSIASLARDGRIHLLIRQAVKSDGSLGVGSGWLTKHLPLHGQVRVRVRSNPGFHAPADAQPLVLIGNGTGIAGLRSHLRERAARGMRRNWLIFGERSRDIDFYYSDEIARWQAEGLLERVDLAFSRDQPERIYVQHRLRENAQTLREWVAEGAAIYVCGSAEGMAPCVENTLTDILGEKAVGQLRDAGRYRRDVY